MKLISSLLAVLSFVPAIGNGVWFPVEAQNWSRH